MLTKIVRRKDFHTLPPDQQAVAKQSVRALQQAYEHWEAENKYQQEQQEPVAGHKVHPDSE